MLLLSRIVDGVTLGIFLAHLSEAAPVVFFRSAYSATFPTAMIGFYLGKSQTKQRAELLRKTRTSGGYAGYYIMNDNIYSDKHISTNYQTLQYKTGFNVFVGFKLHKPFLDHDVAALSL